EPEHQAERRRREQRGGITRPIGFGRGIILVHHRRIAGTAPTHLLDGNPEREQDAGAADDEREKSGVEGERIGKRNDPDEEEEQEGDQEKLFPPITSAIGRHSTTGLVAGRFTPTTLCISRSPRSACPPCPRPARA